MNNIVVSGRNTEQWTDARGFPRNFESVRRIVCLKIDHIGDLLVADHAFRILRMYFPKSFITLVCGTWNVDLAKVMNIADNVIGVAIFNPNGAAQHDTVVALAAREEGLNNLREIAENCGEFDIAIDMRIDTDSRELLKVFQARAYVGIGELREFPFLDVSIPLSDLNKSDSSAELRLTARDYTDGEGYEQGSYGISVQKTVLKIDIDILINGANTPVEAGTSKDDYRLLGIGLESCELRGVSTGEIKSPPTTLHFKAGSPHCKALKAGWAQPEEWGTWTVLPRARLTLALPPESAADEFDLALKFTCHLNPGNPALDLTFLDVNSDNKVEFHPAFPDKDQIVDLRVRARREFGAVSSRASPLRAGDYRLRVETFRTGGDDDPELTLIVCGSSPDRELARYRLVHPSSPGSRRSSSFDYSHLDSEEPIKFVLTAASDQKPWGVFLTAVALEPVRTAPAKVPVGHMEKRIAQLVLAAALQFSPYFATLSSATERAFKSYLHTPDVLNNEFLQEYRAKMQAKRSTHKIVGLGIGATKETKRWPFAYALEFSRHLLSRSDVFLVLVGGPQEMEETDALEKALGQPDRVLNATGKTKLADFSVLVDPMDVYVGYDTGTTHFAGKVGVRTIGIFAAVHSPREWGPVGPNASWITCYTPCSPCYLPTLEACRFGHACMLELSPLVCWEAVSSALDEANSRAGALIEEKDPEAIGASAFGAQPDGPFSRTASVCRVGANYTPSEPASFSHVFVEGWHAVEPSGIWCGQLGRIQILLEGEYDTELSLSFVCLANCEERASAVFTDGRGAKTVFLFDSRAWTTQTATVRPVCANGRSLIDAQFECPDAGLASNWAEAGDMRILGVMVGAFRIDEIALKDSA